MWRVATAKGDGLRPTLGVRAGPRTEHNLFERLVEAARGGAGLTLLVSHRFSTVRAADEISSSTAGGSPRPDRTATSSRNGVYAEFHELQVASYR